MPGTTPAQGWRIPIPGDDPDVVDDITQLANLIEKRVMGVYANTADRDAKVAVSGVEEGMFAFMKAGDAVTYYDGAKWVNWPPSVPAITSGSSVPPNSSGSNGDVFFKI